MTKTRLLNTTQQILCALFIILFIYTGLNKLMDHSTFISQLHKSPFVQWGPRFISYALPISEIILAIGLIIKKTRLLSLYLSFFLMTLFTGYVWMMLNYASDLPCSCGGIIGTMSWKMHLLFNATFVILGIIAIILEYQLKKSQYISGSKLVKTV